MNKEEIQEMFDEQAELFAQMLGEVEDRIIAKIDEKMQGNVDLEPVLEVTKENDDHGLWDLLDKNKCPLFKDEKFNELLKLFEGKQIELLNQTENRLSNRIYRGLKAEFQRQLEKIKNE